jgi:hypothetical protein
MHKRAARPLYSAIRADYGPRHPMIKQLPVQVFLQHAIAHFFEFALTLQINTEKMRDREGTRFRWGKGCCIACRQRSNDAFV